MMHHFPRVEILTWWFLNPFRILLCQFHTSTLFIIRSQSHASDVGATPRAESDDDGPFRGGRIIIIIIIIACASQQPCLLIGRRRKNVPLHGFLHALIAVHHHRQV